MKKNMFITNFDNDKKIHFIIVTKLIITYIFL